MKKLVSESILILFSPRKFLRERIKLPLAKFIYDTIDLYKARTKSGVNNVRDVLFRGTVVALITAIVVWLSIFMYVAFYYAYVPTITHDKPLYLKFKSCNEWDKHKSLCSFPSGSVELNPKQHSLMAGQPYKIFLELDMPESPTNKELGMFMVCADFHGGEGKIITSSCRSAMLQYCSTTMELIRKFLFGPLYLFGHLEEKQKVHIELFSDYLPEDEQITDIHVEIQTKHIEIYSARFTINANFSGLRYVMFNWPIISAAVGITSNLFFIAVVSMISWYQIINSDEYLTYLREHEEKQQNEENKKQLLLKSDSSEDEEEEDVSLIGLEDLEEGLKQRKSSSSNC